MKKLDLYITKKFLGTFIFMIMVIMSIAIVIDVGTAIIAIVTGAILDLAAERRALHFSFPVGHYQ